jgi:hypothetical protein
MTRASKINLLPLFCIRSSWQLIWEPMKLQQALP